MHIEERVNAFIELGKRLNKYLHKNLNGDRFYKILNETSVTTSFENPWFTEESINHSLSVIAQDLSEENISKAFENIKLEADPQHKVATILSGNKPIYGFLEMFCVLITGNIFLAKNTAEDNKLLEVLGDMLIEIEPKFKDRIIFVADRLTDFQGVIANDFKINPQYLYKYFNKYPHIIHRRKYSAAVIQKEDTDEALENFAQDIFTYFGRTLYNVSKVYLPRNFNFEHFFSLIERYNYLFNFSKYANQYEYNKSVFLLNRVDHYDNGFLLLREEKELKAPIATVNYEFYDSVEGATSDLEKKFYALESIVCNNLKHPLAVNPGAATKKRLANKSRFISTINFLSNLRNIL